MPTNREARTILAYEIRGAREVVQSQDVLNKSLGEMGFITKANVGLFRDAARSIRQDIQSEIRDFDHLHEAIDMTDVIRRDTDFIEQLRAEVNGLASDIRELPDPSFYDLTSPIPGAGRGSGRSGKRGGSDGFTERAGDSGSFFSAFGGLEGLGGASPLLQNLGQIGDVAEGLGRMSLAAGAASIAVVAVSLALAELQKGADEAKKILDGALSAQDAYYDALANSTTKQVGELIRELESQRPALEAQLAETQAALDSAWQQAVETYGEAAAHVKDATGILPTTQLREQVERLNEEYQSNIQTQARLEQGLRNTAFAANDAAEAQEALNQFNQEQLQLQAQRNIEAAESVRERELTEQQLRAGTTEQAENYYHQLENQSRALSMAADSLRLSGDTSEEVQEQLAEYNDQLGKNAELMSDIAADIVPYLQALEEQRAAMQLLIDAGHSAAEAERELTEARKAVRLEQERHLAAVDQIEARQTEAETRAALERDRALANLETQSAARQLEAEQKANDDHEKEDTRHREALRKIRETFAKDARQAAASLDANALQDAIEARNLARKNENREHKQRQREIDKTLRDTTADIDRNLQQQQAVINQRYNDQLQTAANAANAALTLEQQKYNAELAIRMAAYNAALAQAQAFAETLISIGASLGRNIVTPDTVTVAPEDLISAGFLQPDAQIPTYHSGINSVPRDTLAFLQRGEKVTAARHNTNNRALNIGDITNSFNGAMTQQQFRETMMEVLNQEVG